MKNVIISFFALLLSLTTFAQVHPKNEVSSKFLELANDKSTSINQVLDKVRKNKLNGFLRDEDQVIPLKLSYKNLTLLKLKSEKYTGKMLSETERDPGYLNEKYLISVLANEVYYGGRIEAQSAVLFECDYAKEDNAKNPTIECISKE